MIEKPLGVLAASKGFLYYLRKGQYSCYRKRLESGLLDGGRRSTSVAMVLPKYLPIYPAIQLVQSSRHYDGMEAFMKRVNNATAPGHSTVALIFHSTGERRNDPQSCWFTIYLRGPASG